MPLAEALARHLPDDADEAAALAEARRLVAQQQRPFDRRLPLHLTASAVVSSRSADRVLLVRHHGPPPRWQQPGGHGEPGEVDGEQVALREAREETGLDGLALHPTAPGPLDVARYTVSARAGEPEHEHLDLRYLAVAGLEPPSPRPDPGGHEPRWFTWQEVESLDLDAGLRRALRKARLWSAERTCPNAR
jgi:8-oxo-dGTP pyrophosphatase MutT (NUDIX family)